MTQQAIQVNVYRREGRLFVVPGATCEVGFKDLDEVIEVQAAGLVHALERAERSALAAETLPMNKRFDTGTSPWKQAGFATYQQFVKNATLVSIVRDDDLTELFFMVPSPDGLGLTGHGAPEELGPGTPLSVVAEHVLAMLDRHAP
jgi:hypothetical protein